MKNQLKQLSPVLEGFKVRIDDKGRVLSEPEDYVFHSFIEGETEEQRKEFTAYDQAKEVIRMPRVMEFIEKAQDGRDINCCEFAGKVIKYNNFLKLPPQLGHYIPCDEDGEPLEEPERFKEWKSSTIGHAHNIGLIEETDFYNCEAYQSALDLVIFEGWEYFRTNAGNGSVIIKNQNGDQMIFFTSGEITLTKTNTISFPKNYEDAFIACPHYVDLTKLK